MCEKGHEKGEWFTCLWVKNEPLVDPQQSQIGGIESFFFWPTGTSNYMWTNIAELLFMYLCV